MAQRLTRSMIVPRSASMYCSFSIFFPKNEIEIHLHNDRGLALGNALYVRDLVDWISCSVNGIGERCGIVDTISLHENLVFLKQREKSNIDFGKKLSKVS